MVPPALVFLALALFIAIAAALLEWFDRAEARKTLKSVQDSARGLKVEVKSLTAERDELKSEHALANQNVQYLYANMGLDSFQSDDKKKQFIDAVGVFARDGDIQPLLRMRDADLTQTLGMSSAELSDLMTFRNHIDGEWIRQPAKAAKSLDVLASRLSAIAAMEQVWRDKTSDIADIRKLLADNMWVFEPDYVVSKGRLWIDRAISTIAGGSGEGSERRPDIVAITALSASLQSTHQWRDIHRTGLLLVDLKAPGTRIGADEKTRGWEYARELMKSGVIKPSMAVDCFVVGKEVDEEEGAPRTEGWASNVRIVPLSYDQLIARAKRLTMDLVRVLGQTPERYDDKVHAMPEPEAEETMAAPDLAADAEAAAEEMGVERADAHQDAQQHEHQDEHHDDHPGDDGHHDGDGHHDDDRHDGDGAHPDKPKKAKDGAGGRHDDHHDHHDGEHHAADDERRIPRRAAAE
jgi:hypothetical protein